MCTLLCHVKEHHSSQRLEDSTGLRFSARTQQTVMAGYDRDGKLTLSIHDSRTTTVQCIDPDRHANGFDLETLKDVFHMASRDQRQLSFEDLRRP